MKTFFLTIIRIYQRTLSPDHGLLRWRFPYGYCKYYPSCSEYARQSLTKHSLAQGLRLTALRLLKCHPWSEGGADPVPTILK